MGRTALGGLRICWACFAIQFLPLPNPACFAFLSHVMICRKHPVPQNASHHLLLGSPSCDLEQLLCCRCQVAFFFFFPSHSGLFALILQQSLTLKSILYSHFISRDSENQRISTYLIKVTQFLSCKARMKSRLQLQQPSPHYFFF